jgi:hypothetical protein
MTCEMDELHAHARYVPYFLFSIAFTEWPRRKCHFKQYCVKLRVLDFDDFQIKISNS